MLAGTWCPEYKIAQPQMTHAYQKGRHIYASRTTSYRNATIVSCMTKSGVNDNIRYPTGGYNTTQRTGQHMLFTRTHHATRKELATQLATAEATLNSCMLAIMGSGQGRPHSSQVVKQG